MSEIGKLTKQLGRPDFHWSFLWNCVIFVGFFVTQTHFEGLQWYKKETLLPLVNKGKNSNYRLDVYILCIYFSETYDFDIMNKIYM